MTATRWTLILLAAGAMAGGWFFISREPVGVPTAIAAAPAASPLGLPLPPTAASGPAASAALHEPTPVVTAAASAPRIGSEGYGPHIERAQAGSDAKAAWESVTWLRQCANNEAQRHNLETVRNQGVSPEMMTQLMVETDADERRCQTVTDRHRALLPELAARAMRAGVPEAVAAYANATFPNDLTPAQRQQVADVMRRDARSGDAASLLGALTAHEAWGLGDAEKLAYLATYLGLPEHPEAQPHAKALMEQGSIRFKTPPTTEQLDAVTPAVREILERVRTPKS